MLLKFKMSPTSLSKYKYPQQYVYMCGLEWSTVFKAKIVLSKKNYTMWNCYAWNLLTAICEDFISLSFHLFCICTCVWRAHICLCKLACEWWLEVEGSYSLLLSQAQDFRQSVQIACHKDPLSHYFLCPGIINVMPCLPGFGNQL